MSKGLIICTFVFVLISFSQPCDAKEILHTVVFEHFTEIWHHSGGYWTGNIPRTIWDNELPDLLNNPDASTKFTNVINKTVVDYEPLPEAVLDYIHKGNCISDIHIEIIFGYDRSKSSLFVENSFAYSIDPLLLNTRIEYQPRFELHDFSFYKNYPIPTPRHPSDYIKFAIYHAQTGALLGVMAADDSFDYDWIVGTCGYLYHPSNPWVTISEYGVEKSYRLNDLRIGNGTFENAGAIGYFFTHTVTFVFSVDKNKADPEPPKSAPDPALHVFFSAVCGEYYATNNPDYPVYVDSYPVYLDLIMDYETVDTVITHVKLERKAGHSWTLLAQNYGPMYIYRHTSDRESEMFRLTVQAVDLDPVVVTITSYTELKHPDHGWVSVDFYLYDQQGRLVNNNYNHPIVVPQLPYNLNLLSIIPDQDANFYNVHYTLFGNGQRETLDIGFGNNPNTPARYLENRYDLSYLYKGMPPLRLPRHYVFFRIEEPLLFVSAKIEGYIQRWDGTPDLFGMVPEVKPHRFVSLERVRVTVTTQGFADTVTIRFCPNLEATQYVSSHGGHVYDMESDFGIAPTSFPKDTTFSLDATLETNQVVWEYVLPLAEDTLDWQNVRRRPPYTMTVFAYREDASTVHVIDDIEITGSVFDLIHMQPHF